jgi:hypothetical protein
VVRDLKNHPLSGFRFAYGDIKSYEGQGAPVLLLFLSCYGPKGLRNLENRSFPFCSIEQLSRLA